MENQPNYPKKRTFYRKRPDYEKPLLELPEETRRRMHGRLKRLYGPKKADQALPELERILKVHFAHKTDEMLEKEKSYDPRERFSENDMVLITYGDIVKGGGDTPLSALHNFVNAYNRGGINTIHLLPFFPYSSDRGFAVVDFSQVDPELGTWEDIQEKKRRYDLMFDAVLNHVSAESEMFREFCSANPRYKEFFIAYDSPDDLTPDQRSKIFRPRTTDILTRFETLNGPKWIWTTFSEDQIDLNFRNPDLLIQVINSILFYVRHGADILRLDAVTYIWAEPGTESVHLPQTHEIVKLLRDVLDAVASGVAIITETNVPHDKNVSYFGDGTDEAHMVYNFALPPLVLHTFYRENAGALTRWAAEKMVPPSDMATFFNILDTHDGVGLMGVKGILSEEEIDFIVTTARDRGALVSYKMKGDKTKEPYEINTTWWSAVNGADSTDDLRLQIKRYLASRSISLVLKGVPGIYVHGALGSANDPERVNRTGVKRDINRGIIYSDRVEEALHDPDSKLSLILYYGSKLNLTRNRNRAFHPRGEQTVLDISTDVFAVLRTTPEGDENVLAVTNVTKKEVRVDISLEELGIEEVSWQDLLSERLWEAQGKALRLILQPYDVAWLKPVKDVQGKGWL